MKRKDGNMKLEVFDNKHSFIHFLCGILCYFWLSIFIIFIFYEIIEFIYKKGKEKPQNFLGDVVEFLFGLGLATLLMKSLDPVL